MKFLLFAPDQFLVGTFTLNMDSRVWTFDYSDSFKGSGYAPLEDFPLTNCQYGHEACVRWLACRLYEKPAPDKGLTIAHAIKNHFNNKNYPLSLEMVV